MLCLWDDFCWSAAEIDTREVKSTLWGCFNRHLCFLTGEDLTAPTIDRVLNLSR
ncbi:hypothetical protein VL20_4121 [Microcystis panniformis FACHB-1757]|uniref:Uncharacterized protein n=1 Tax=Microcystis panniformis FACHB-1757 TaxID=1638788 RepID=A0A0K1S4S8_9CHRO|nr:hypothetical protein VL20_4121 [Microcystis panniformis FACHB-1757]